jgi:pyruvate-ferredoxin/flavodoxin oxidoreductase
MNRAKVTIDGNEATAYIAHKLSEVIAIYPITPSSGMGELADEWSAKGRTNVWGTVPHVIELQSEGGASGSVHGALQTGALTTTFTASQGLLLMIPNMFKIAGELTPTVFHVSARALAAQALSIFGDHSDVMATRQTGFALLASNSVQEAQDMSAIAHAATLEARIPFVHFFDGFRTSHEVNKIEQLTDEDLRSLVEQRFVHEHRARGLSPDRPVLRGTAQNPDIYFQARETVNPYYYATPEIVQKYMDRFAEITGRQYHLFEYVGSPDAERVIVIMGSGAETTEETVKYLNDRGEKVGMLKVHLFRPFSVEHFIGALPASVQTIAVLDRCKEPGSAGEPLYQDVITALNEAWTTNMPRIIGGRYGLSSKEFTPAMVKGVFDEMLLETPKNHFMVGINDDITHNSISYDDAFHIEAPETRRCLFWGLGADGTVGANKNSIKIIGEETDNFAQGYFVYDSRKSGQVTISHLRFGPKPIRAPYLITQAQFIACHQFSFLERLDVIKAAEPGGVFLLNSIYGPDEVWDNLPRETQQSIIDKKLRFFVIDAYEVAKQTGMGGRINTIMQTCFFAISGVLPADQAIAEIKHAIEKTYSKRGEAVVRANFEAVDATLKNLYEVNVPDKVTSKLTRRPPVPVEAPQYVQDFIAPIIQMEGDNLPVSALPVDGTFPTASTQWERRNIALEIPAWDENLCIQCGKCVMVCPHAVIREKVYEPSYLANAPEGWVSVDARWKEFPEMKYTLAVAPEDCTGCGICIEVCPAKDKSQVGRKAINMVDQTPIREREVIKWEYFKSIPDIDRTTFSLRTVKNSQLLRPLFEFSLACAGCGETPYIKLLTQLFGDRIVISNATGCSSIYGGNLPTIPYAKNDEGRGPAWSNSLFEDNAEFGLGFRLTMDKQNEYARELLVQLKDVIGEQLVSELLDADQSSEAGLQAQRERVAMLKQELQNVDNPKARELLSIADILARKSVWIIGGDGWAYDIGYGGLDHVLASGRNVNVLVLDTEVYSNTGGQASKSTPRAAVAKFAANGKGMPKKDLGMIAMAYGYVYVARVAMGASDQQTLNAFMEADAYDGPSLIIAYSHCIAHGYDLKMGLEQQKLAVASGHWPLYRYNPALIAQGQNPLSIDSKEPSVPLSKYAYNESRYRMLLQTDETRAEMLMQQAQRDVKGRWDLYRQMAAMHYEAEAEKSNE